MKRDIKQAERLEKFLRKKRCYTRFQKKRQEFHNIPFEEYAIGEAEMLITGAFVFPAEEMDFWYALSRAWQKELKNVPY